MRKKTLIIVSVIIVLAGLVYLNMNKKKKENENINIVTTFYPVYIASLNITDGVEDIKISNVTQNTTTCLHDYTLSTNQMAEIASADLLVINGAGMEPFVNNISKSVNNIKIVDSSLNTSILEGHSTHEEQEDEKNSHIYLDINNYKVQVKNICNAIEILDGSNKDKYAKNRDEYILKLNNLEEKWKSLKNEVNGTTIVVYNSALEYITCMLDLKVLADLEIDHESGISSEEIIDTIKKIKENKVRYILVPNDYDKKIISLITSGLDVEIIQQDLFVYGDNSKDAYIDVMEKNLNNLKSIKNN